MSNIPPGCSAGSIPGNRAEDVAEDKFWDWAMEHLADLDISERRRAVLIGKAAVLAEQHEVELAFEEANRKRESEAVDYYDRLAEEGKQ